MYSSTMGTYGTSLHLVISQYNLFEFEHNISKVENAIIL